MQATIDDLRAQLAGAAQAPMDREKVAKIFAYIWHGDLSEWQGFLSKADAFLTYPVPSTNHLSPHNEFNPETEYPGSYGAVSSTEGNSP